MYSLDVDNDDNTQERPIPNVSSKFGYITWPFGLYWMRFVLLTIGSTRRVLFLNVWYMGRLVGLKLLTTEA